MAKSVTIPPELVPKFEAWGKLTMELFGQLRRQTGIAPKGVPKDQEWYWSKQWQQWEREADADIAAGRTKKFDSMEELIADLDL